MSASNGRGPLRLGDLVPETRPVLIERRGVTVTLRAYVNGRRCPGRIKARVASASQAYLAATEDGVSDPAPAWMAYLCDVLLEVVEGIEYTEAEVLAGRDDEAVPLLEALGWWTPAPEAMPGPEAAGGALRPISVNCSPCSATPTPASPLPTFSPCRSA
jgi:hypothetical protein